VVHLRRHLRHLVFGEEPLEMEEARLLEEVAQLVGVVVGAEGST
jgi:hypothetical protein